MFLFAAPAATARTHSAPGSPIARVAAAAFALAASALILFAHEPSADVASAHIALMDRVVDVESATIRALAIAAGIAQAALIVLMFRRHAAWTGATAAVALTALGSAPALSILAQVGMSLAIVTAAALALIPPDARARLPLVGAFVAAAALIRPSAGAVLAIGVVTYALLEAPRDRRARHNIIGPVALTVMLAGLGAFLVRMSEAAGLLHGALPLAILGYALFRVRVPNADVVLVLARLGAGAAVIAASVFAYRMPGIVPGLDIGPAAFDPMSRADAAHLAALEHAAMAVISPDGIAAALRGAFRIALVLLPVAIGIGIIAELARSNRWSPLPHPLPFIATFFALASTQESSAAALFSSAGLTAAALLHLFGGRSDWRQPAASLAVAALAGFALYR